MATVTRIKRIAPLQFGKVLAVLYGLLSLIIVPFYTMFLALASFAPPQRGGGAPTIMLGFGVIMILILPVFYACMGFIFGVISAFIYNLVASWIGGIEIELE